jgi:hypothetical protein
MREWTRVSLVVAWLAVGCGASDSMNGPLVDAASGPDGSGDVSVTFVVNGHGLLEWESGSLSCAMDSCMQDETMGPGSLQMAWMPTAPYEFVSLTRNGEAADPMADSYDVAPPTTTFVVTFAPHTPGAPCAVPPTFGQASCADTEAASRNGGASVFGNCELEDDTLAHRMRVEIHGAGPGSYDLSQQVPYDTSQVAVLIFPDQMTPIVGPSAGNSAYWCDEGTMQIDNASSAFDVTLDGLVCRLVDIDASFMTTDDPSGCTTEVWHARMTDSSITPM